MTTVYCWILRIICANGSNNNICDRNVSGNKVYKLSMLLIPFAVRIPPTLFAPSPSATCMPSSRPIILFYDQGAIIQFP